MGMIKKIWHSVTVERIKSRVKKALMFIVNKTIGVRNKAVFRSFSGSHYSDNPRAISEMMHAIDPTVEIVWMMNDGVDEKLPAYVRRASNSTPFIIWEYATASYWIDNFELQDCYYKARNQRYVQTWHGDRSFKRVICQSSYLNFNSRRLIENQVCDLCLAGSAFGLETYRTAFKYYGPVLMTGTPRCDRLINAPERATDGAKVHIGLDPHFRYVLYAPTFRDSDGFESNESCSIFDADSVVECLEGITGEAWKCLLRAHPSIKGQFDGESSALNVSAVPDMMDVLEASDILISDYSSSVGDFCLTGRPVLLYQYDIEDYTAASRELRFDMNKSPYSIARTHSELLDLLKEITLDPDGARNNCNAILDFYESSETGQSALDVCRFLLDGELDKSNCSIGAQVDVWSPSNL